ncbi:MAG: DnaD domain protein [Lachnospiraceae bacterium]|nr:DnaD domain protein [Lachnospiraceae bacterium]
MAALNIYKEQLNEYTVISNYFIDHYMEDANEAQLQVYLYLLRMVSANLQVSVADIADKFKHSEKEVLRALKYWELQKLLSLDFDNKKNLTGIHLLAMPMAEVAAPVTEMSATPAVTEVVDRTGSPTVSEAPVMSAPQPVTEALSMQTPETSEAQTTRNASETAVFSEAPRSLTSVQPLQEEFEKPSIYVKPTYTAEQLREFKTQESAAQLLYVAQAYIGKPLSVSDVKTIYFMWDVLHFSDDLIDYLIQYCVERGKKDFRYMEKVAINWAEDGITTPKQAQKSVAKYEKSVYTIMNALGKSNTPTTKELEFIQRWTNEYGFSLDIIIEACDRTVLATDKHRFEYAEGILSNWKRENVQRKSDITKIDTQYQKQKASAPKQPATTNRFNQFTQNTYDFAELEKELLSN